MIEYRNGSNKAVVVIHEIYGINNHIEKVSIGLSKLGFDVFVPDMLGDKQVFDYAEESSAYSNFMDNVGFVKASNLIISCLHSIRDRYEKVYVLGFSVGATVAWLCAGEHSLCDGVAGLYGSRIMDYLSATPSCPVLLLFPQKEKSFNVDDLIDTLDKMDSVHAEKLSGNHGFADPFSRNYNEDSFILARDKVLDFILH